MGSNLSNFWPYIFVALLAGCGGGSTGAPGDDQAQPKGLLVPLENDAMLVQSVTKGFGETLNRSVLRNGVVDFQNDAIPVMTMEDSGSSFTTTYTLEANVDEHDFVKYNGDHLFIAPTRGMDCCFIVDDIVRVEDSAEAAMADIMPSPESQNRSIRIVATDPDNAGATEVATIALEDSRTVEGLYTHGSQLAAISSSGWWGSYGSSFSRISSWQGQTTALNIYDISDISAPTTQMQIEFEGGFVNSRKKGDIIYLVARHTPEVEGFHYYPTDQEVIENETLLSELTVEDLLPKVSVNGVESLLIGANDCLIADTDNALSPAETGYPTMTLLIAVDLADQSIANSSCYLEPTAGIYVSENAIYLTQSDYSDESPSTLVHAYELSPALSYQGSGAVEGALYLSGDRDFRINEHEGYLRIVTTQHTGDESDRIDHQLSVLKLNTQELEMELVATLPNTERPQAIGKPNEDLYGVRFFGDKLYLVTFERIDPLYVLDLSAPTDPLIAGELTVTGFSDFLHPVSDELLIGLGQDENGLVKLELFNVAEISDPYSLGTNVLGENEGAQWSHSEARYNRHAFTYQAISQSQDRFLVPATMSFYDAETGYRDEDRLYLFELNGKDSAELASIDEIGQIKVIREWYQSSRNRSVIHGDGVYYINGTSVWSTIWTNPTEQNGPL